MDGGVANAGRRAYLPVLDGVRGIAILLVMFHHFWVFSAPVPPENGPAPVASVLTLAGRTMGSAAATGWVGVDLFFVLSGFLITGILLDTKGSARYFRTFYIRRTLRIFPLYVAFLAIVCLFPQLVLPGIPDAREHVSATAVWYWTYTTNVLIAGAGWEAVPLPLGHLWSLAIEEQFYLIWPLIVFRATAGTLVKICLAVMAGSLALRCAALAADVTPVAVYVFSLTRMDALAAGALVALVMRQTDGPLRRHWRWMLAGSALVLGLAVVQDHHLSYENPVVRTLGYSALACLFAVFVGSASLASPGTRAGAALSTPLLRWFGRHSYGMYVLHVPLIFALVWLGLDPGIFPAVLGSMLPGKLLVVATATAVSAGLAAVSWWLLESRVLALKERFTYSCAASTGWAAPADRKLPTAEAQELPLAGNREARRHVSV